MKARRRIIVAASAALLAAGAPALAQDTATPAQNELIGPPQLRDFNLNGTVTRQAEQPSQQAPAQRQPPAQQTTNSNAQTAPSRPSQPARQPSAAESRPQAAPRDEPEARSSRPAQLDLAPPTPARPSSSGPNAQPVQPAASAGAQAGDSTSPLEVPGDGVPILPWLIAALALAGAAGWYVLRQRPRESYAGAAGLAFEAPTPPARPAEAKRPPPAPPAPAPAPQPSSGIVSTRLRPWIDIEFVPQRAVVDEQKAAIQFELSVINSGSIPARDVLVEASLFSAGAMQDQQIRTFFENPVAQGDRIPVIGPMQRVTITTAVVLPREQVRVIEMEGRQLFVPLVAFNALYAWGRGQGQSSASYLVGRETSGEKLGPFRVDLGPRMFRNLASREHELRLRN